MTPDQADAAAGGDPVVLAIIACTLTLLCILWATGVFARLRELHRARMRVVRAHDGGPVRHRLAWLDPRHDGKDSSWLPPAE